jgi:hypothetical protein
MQKSWNVFEFDGRYTGVIDFAGCSSLPEIFSNGINLKKPFWWFYLAWYQPAC